MTSPRIAHFPRPHVIVPDRHIVATLEGETEQRIGGEEGGLDHLIKQEIRLDARLIHIAARLAQLFGVMAPVPRREGESPSLRLHYLLHGIAVRKRGQPRRRADTVVWRS